MSHGPGHAARKHTNWKGDLSPVCLRLSNFVQLEHVVIGQDEGFPSFCCASWLLFILEGRKVDLSAFLKSFAC